MRFRRGLLPIANAEREARVGGYRKTVDRESGTTTERREEGMRVRGRGNWGEESSGAGESSKQGNWE